jgi:uncharacterized protein (DUF885 family)
MMKFVAILPLLLFAAGCGPSPSERFAKLSEEFVYTTIAFSPAGATSVGLHQYNNQNLDDQLDDVSPAALEKQRQFYHGFRDRLAALDPAKLTAEDRADLRIIQDQIALALLDLEEVHSEQHNPTTYVETLGNALFNPYVLEYAPLPARIAHVIARLREVPRYLQQATANLTSAPEIWTKVAIDENDGNSKLIGDTIRNAVPPDQRSSYDAAAAPAMAAIAQFQAFLTNTLSGRTDADWRLGPDRYARKFRYMLESGMEPADALRRAEQDLQTARAHMLEIALPLHRQWFAAEHKDYVELSADERINHVVGEVLDHIAQRHSTPQAYMDDARQTLEEARAFVQQKRLLTLPARANLQVVPTPEFMRGVYSVGGFDPAPALEPQLGAFYWVTPIPAGWPKARVESKLREYNYYGLRLLTIHEAMPGHYVQFEFADDVQPKTRRVLRAVYGNNPYVEGWAVYATQMMLDEGYLDHSPEMALTFAKQSLRVYANTILDIRMQSMNMTDQEALDLMEKQTFQEKEEAEGKLQRAKLTSCQLPVYFVGWRAWQDIRDAYQKSKGSAFSLPDFHDRALKEGAVPLAVLGGLLQ